MWVQMTTSKEAWSVGRPVYKRLPYNGYQDNSLVDHISNWVDFRLTQASVLAQNFYREVSPDTAQDASLDYLAWLVGMSGQYWDTTWSSSVKRAMIRLAHPVLWKNRGTEVVLRKVLDIHGIEYNIWTDGNLQLGFILPGTFGTPKLRFFLRLPLSYLRSGPVFREARRTVANFSPALVQKTVCYDRFYLGFSLLGDPLFSR